MSLPFPLPAAHLILPRLRERRLPVPIRQSPLHKRITAAPPPSFLSQQCDSQSSAASSFAAASQFEASERDFSPPHPVTLPTDATLAVSAPPHRTTVAASAPVEDNEPLVSPHSAAAAAGLVVRPAGSLHSASSSSVCTPPRSSIGQRPRPELTAKPANAAAPLLPSPPPFVSKFTNSQRASQAFDTSQLSAAYENSAVYSQQRNVSPSQYSSTSPARPLMSAPQLAPSEVEQDNTAQLEGGIDELHKVDLQQFIVPIERALKVAMVYLWCIRIIDRDAYLTWLEQHITTYQNDGDSMNMHRFTRLRATAIRCTGNFLYYFGCSSDIAMRYKDDDSSWVCVRSKVHVVHAPVVAAESPAPFEFFYGALSVTDTVTQLELEGQLAGVVGIDQRAINARLVLNARPLGRAYGTFAIDRTFPAYNDKQKGKLTQQMTLTKHESSKQRRKELLDYYESQHEGRSLSSVAAEQLFQQGKQLVNVGWVAGVGQGCKQELTLAAAVNQVFTTFNDEQKRKLERQLGRPSASKAYLAARLKLVTICRQKGKQASSSKEEGGNG